MRRANVVAAVRQHLDEPDASMSVHRDREFWHAERQYFEGGVAVIMYGGATWVVVDATGEVFDSSASLPPSQRIEDVKRILDSR